ncbi:hypothetical protein [Fluviicola taffensis]|uniref:hypothetical protein n=1 Tax=Fluviicola taffensis TaxID=191579 RepID=UPI003137AFDC
MRNCVFPIVFILFFTNSYGQRIEIAPVIGYNFNATYYDGFNNIRFDDGVVFGGNFNFQIKNVTEIGFSYLQQFTTVDVYSYQKDTSLNVSVGISRYHLTGNRSFEVGGSGKIFPFAGLGIGVTNYYDRAKISSRVKASVTIQAGVRFDISDKLNVKFSGQLMLPISSIGLGIGFGSSGVSVGTNSHSSMIQLGLQASIGYYIGW